MKMAIRQILLLKKRKFRVNVKKYCSFRSITSNLMIKLKSSGIINIEVDVKDRP
jgi:hypothetical protein